MQRYECIYGKFSKDCKNKYIRLNSWKAIGEKFGLDAPEAERRYKNCRTSYGRYLKKRKSVPSGSGRNAVPTPAEFANLEWLNNRINHRAETSVKKIGSHKVRPFIEGCHHVESGAKMIVVGPSP